MILGTGLNASYYNSQNYTSLAFSRVDPQVSLFFLDSNSPDPRLNTANSFSVKWTGFIVPLFSETYTFSTPGPDSELTVTVGGEVVSFDYHHKYDGTLPPRSSQTIALTAGVPASIEVDFIEYAGNLDTDPGNSANAQLWWQSPSQAAQLVPQSQLYPAITVPVIPAPSLTATPQLVNGVPSIILQGY